MGRRIAKAGLAASAALLLAACGGGTDPTTVGSSGSGGAGAGKGETGGGDAKTASLAQPNTVTLSFCHKIEYGGGGRDYALTVESLSLKDGSIVATRSTVLPNGVEPARGCPTSESGGPQHQVALAFNKDYTLVAGMKGMSRAGAWDVATGKEVGAPDPDAFSKRPKNRGVAFHPVTGRLWYDMGEHDYQSSDDVASRDPKAGLTSEERVAYEKLGDLMKLDGPTATTVLATDDSDYVAAPDGGIVAGGSADGMWLSRVKAEGRVGANDFLEPIETGGLDAPELGCKPVFWRDATTLVCDEFQQVTFSADYKKVVKTEKLIPANDRSNSDPVLAPDGKSFAFLSEGENGKKGLFRADFVPGGEPVKIADVEEPADAPHHLTYLLRWN
ncbi:hypothetical protein ACF05T_26790 [Streptomyces lateritius]|uniref:WD40 repeat protein n=1 Tax=Streptomyces lateritius TaxID=67313 RepID=A0ABW6YIL1_9ACTN